MSDLLNLQLARLHRHRRVQRVVERLMPIVLLSLISAATVVILVRLALPDLADLVPALVAAAVLVPVIAAPAAWRRRDTAADLAGHLDLLIDGRGLAMALAAQPTGDADWAARLRQPLERFQAPALHLPKAWATTGAALLLAIACLLPQQTITTTTRNPVEALFAGLDTTLSGLEDLGAATPERLTEHRTKLEELRAHAGKRGMDQATWAARDRLEQAMRADTAAASRRLAEALAQAEVAAASPSAAAESAQAMAQHLGELAARAPGLVPKIEGADAQAMREALAQAVQQGLLTPEQQQALERLGFRPERGQQAQLNGDQQRALAEALRQKLAERARALGTRQRGGGDSDGDGEGDGFGDDLAEARARRAGRGGVGRGPGHTDHPQLPTDRFGVGTVDDLPPGARVNPDGSITLAEQVRDPDLEAEAMQDAVRAAAQAFDPAAADARRSQVAPRHRATVGRYFAQTPAATGSSSAQGSTLP